MKTVLLTGANGILGRFIQARLREDGHRLTSLGRTRTECDQTGHIDWSLEAQDVTLPKADVLIHCALAHEPGKYRGGEGEDPHGFIDLNVDGTVRLFEAAKAAGIPHVVFLSSRAVYSGVGNWEVLTETSETIPDNLYGQVKLAGEQALQMLSGDAFTGTVLRSTGVYGRAPGQDRHKWSDLFETFENGQLVAPRHGTEVHGADLAASVALLLEQRPQSDVAFEIYNVSDVLLDRQELLQAYAAKKGTEGHLPQRADTPLGVMDTSKLAVLGWAPGGKERLNSFLDEVT